MNAPLPCTGDRGLGTDVVKKDPQISHQDQKNKRIKIIFYNGKEPNTFRAVSELISVGAGFSIEFDMTFSSSSRFDIHCEWTPGLPKNRRQHRAVQRGYKMARRLFFAAVSAEMGGPVAIIDTEPGQTVTSIESIYNSKCVICRAPGRQIVQFLDDDSRRRLNALRPGEADNFFMLCQGCAGKLCTEEGREEIGEKLIALVADNIRENRGEA